MFKVLVIAYYFPPMGLSGVQRTLKFVKYMSKYNWEPTVLTAGDVGYFAHDNSLLKEAEEAKIRIIRTGGKDVNSLLSRFGTISIPKEFIRNILSKISKAIFIPDNKNAWAKEAYIKAKELLQNEQFDAIFVTIPPYSSFVMAAKLKKEFDLPLFVDYRDLWFNNQFSFYPTPYHRYKHKKLEYTSLRATEKIITINRRIKENILKRYGFLSFEDVLIIPHGYDRADFEKLEPIPRSDKKLWLTYSGIFYENITPEYLLHAFKKLSIERPDIAQNIELHFVGHLGKSNTKLISKLGLNGFIRDYGYIDHNEALRKVISSDVLWMMVGPALNADTISTGKLFEYIGSRKPILGCVPDGVAKSTLTDYGASFIVKPDDIEEIKSALIKIHDLFKSKKLPVPNEDFVLKHDREVLTEQLIKQFQFFLREP
jgi:glycosyltransferase involved in cell wall biosynthesis